MKSRKDLGVYKRLLLKGKCRRFHVYGYEWQGAGKRWRPQYFK